MDSTLFKAIWIILLSGLILWQGLSFYFLNRNTAKLSQSHEGFSSILWPGISLLAVDLLGGIFFENLSGFEHRNGGGWIVVGSLVGFLLTTLLAYILVRLTTPIPALQVVEEDEE